MRKFCLKVASLASFVGFASASYPEECFFATSMQGPRLHRVTKLESDFLALVNYFKPGMTLDRITVYRGVETSKLSGLRFRLRDPATNEHLELRTIGQETENRDSVGFTRGPTAVSVVSNATGVCNVIFYEDY